MKNGIFSILVTLTDLKQEGGTGWDWNGMGWDGHGTGTLILRYLENSNCPIILMPNQY